jgi:alpha-ribazole phosphatase/probable phosphoglycerate mutase
MERRRRELIFETHAISEDNEHGIASGWNATELSERGRHLAAELGQRNADAEIVYTSDLRRAVQTAEIAFASSPKPIRLDQRLRECDYGALTGHPAKEFSPRSRFITAPYPAGESYVDVVKRVASFLSEIESMPQHSILVIGHSATRWALEHLLERKRLEDLVDKPFEWKPGWRFRL